MWLIAILFCLALQRFANVGGWFKEAWFEAYLRQIGSKLAKIDERLVLLFIVAPVLLLFGLIQLIFSWHWFGLADLILSTAVLFLCIDARDFKTRLVPYFQGLERSDIHEATVAVNDFISDATIGDIADLRREVTRAILLNSFKQLFAGLFWFMVFGVYGVATYFLIVMLTRTALRVSSDYIKLTKFSAKVQSVLEWLPVRLLGFSYILVGNFNKGFHYCIKNFGTGLNEVDSFAIDSGFAALGIDLETGVSKAENRAALDLVNRVLIIWVVAAVLVFIGFWF